MRNILFLLFSCGPSNEQVFLQQAIAATCMCYDDEIEYTRCVRDLTPQFQAALYTLECSSLYHRDAQFDNAHTAECLARLREKAIELDQYCRSEIYLAHHPDEDCEVYVTEYSAIECDPFDGPYYQDYVDLLEQCPTICQN